MLYRFFRDSVTGNPDHAAHVLLDRLHPMNDEGELERLRHGPGPAERPPEWALARLDVDCPGNARIVLAGCREVLEIVLRQDPARWPSDAEWRELLPAWFVQASADEISREEAERRLHLPLRKRDELDEPWSVGAFVYWFLPDNRYWSWWDAVVLSPDRLRIELEAADVFPSEALAWLLRASGASSVDKR